MTRLTRFMWLLLLFGLGTYLALTLWLGFVGLVYPYQLDYGEGIVLWFARELARGHSIYGLPGFPYASSNYPPVAMLLAAALFPVFGDGYTAGRLLNFASALIVAVLIFRIVRAEAAARVRTVWSSPGVSDSSVAEGTGPALAQVEKATSSRQDASAEPTEHQRARLVAGANSISLPGPGATGWIAALAAALFFIGSPYVYHWVPLFRTDLLGLCFALSGVYLVWRWERHLVRGANPQAVGSSTDGGRVNPTWNLAVAALLFLLALYTKQTLFAAPAAASMAIFSRDRRTGLKFAIAIGAVGGAAYLALDAATRGGFTFGLITSNATTFLPEQLVSLVWSFVTTFPVLLLLALAGWIARVRARRVGVLEWYAAAAFAMLVLGGRVGAWENYFFEALASTCVFAGIAIGRAHQLQARDLGARLGAEGRRAAKLLDIAPTPFSSPLRSGDLRPEGEGEVAPLSSRSPLKKPYPTLTLPLEKGREQRSSRVPGRVETARRALFSVESSRRGAGGEVGGGLCHSLGAERGSLALALVLLVQVALTWHDPGIAANLVAQGAPANAELAALLERTHGPIISEDMGALVTSGKPVLYYTFQYSSLARSGKWDQSWELNGLRSGSLPLVILETGTREDVDHYRRFTREFVSALDRYYSLARELGAYEIYEPAPPLRLQTAKLGPIAMVGWNVAPYSSESGGIPVTIVWQAERGMDRSYTAFVHLERADGSKVAQADSPPHDGAYPTSNWAQGEYVRERYLLRLPGPPPIGDYALRVGWYDPASGDRLVVPDSNDDSVLLQTGDLVRE